jgi:hypothetical protein
MHLWYLLALFVLSIVLLPVFLLLKSKTGSRVLGKLMDLLSLPGLVYVLALAILLSWKLIDRNSVLGFDKFGWSLGAYVSFFLFGFAIMASDKAQQSIQRLRWISLLGAIVLTVNLISGNPDAHRDLIAWFFILTFLGFGMKHLNFNTPFLKYANEAVLPFYILHQTILLCTGYFILQWAIPDLLQWALIVASSFSIIMGIFEILIRRFNVLRFLFGMKPLPRQPVVQPRETVLAR